MSKSRADLERARQRLDPAWGPRKVEAELAQLEARIETRKNRPVAALLVIAASGACAALYLLIERADGPLASRLEGRAPVAESVSSKALRAPQPAEIDLPDPLPNAGLPDAGVARATVDVNEPQPAEHLTVQRRSSRVKIAGAAWRSLAREGRYQEAYRAMRGSEPDRRSAQVDELLLAGDAARLSGHAREAIPYYRAALDRAGTSSRAHLAAFTLGRTLLNEVNEPSAAADAFARAYKASPRGPLAEEALAREAESWRRAGDLTRAQEAAARYQSAYPKGRLLKR